jgi:site-specific DNA-methyltransferase (adenine-specific)
VTGIFHIVLARKPLEGTIAENCLQWGCGALWIDGTRVGTDWSKEQSVRLGHKEKITQSNGAVSFAGKGQMHSEPHAFGRWPANLVVGGEETVRKFPFIITNSTGKGCLRGIGFGKSGKGVDIGHRPASSGSASRFFFNFSEQESDE